MSACGDTLISTRNPVPGTRRASKARPNASALTGWPSSANRHAAETLAHSHSIVAGGLLLMS